MKKIQRWIVMTDIHCPYEDKETLKAVEKLMGDYKFDGYLSLGDFMDFDCISYHNHGKPLLTETRRLLEDYDKANIILDRHQKIIRKKNKDARFVLLEGNHEERVERLIEAQPQLQGLIEVEKNLRLKERGFEFIRSCSVGDDFILGHAHFHHGIYTSDGHSKKHVSTWGTNIFYGHLHDIQSYSMVLRGKDKTIVGQSLGCLCDYNQQYMKGHPSKWQQAVTIFEVLPNGFFSYSVIRIFNHKFVYNGKEY